MVVQAIVGPVIETLTNKKLSRAFLYYFNPLAFNFELNHKRRSYCAVWSHFSFEILCSVPRTLQNEMDNRQNFTIDELLRLGNVYLDFKIRIFQKVKRQKVERLWPNKFFVVNTADFLKRHSAPLVYDFVLRWSDYFFSHKLLYNVFKNNQKAS